MSRPAERRACIAILLAAGLVLSFLAMREAARRILWTQDVDATVTALDVRTEKHPGRDDRYSVTLRQDGGDVVREIDGSLFAKLHEGVTITGRAWDEHRMIDGRPERVLLPAEPMTLALAALVGPCISQLAQLLIAWRRRRAPARG